MGSLALYRTQDDLLVVSFFSPQIDWGWIALLTWGQIPFQICVVNYPETAFSGPLPQVYSPRDHKLLSSSEALHMIKTRANLDMTLSTTNKSLSTALCSVIQGTLRQCLLAICWVEDESYSLTKREMQSSMPFPLGWILPSYTRQKQKMLVQLSSYNLNYRSEIRQLYSVFSTLLVESGGRYCFGSHPSTVDALLFGHLCQAIKYPALQEILSKFPKLNEFHERIFNELNTSQQNLISTHLYDASRVMEVGKKAIRTPSTSPSEVKKATNSDPFKKNKKQFIIASGGLLTAYLLLNLFSK